MSHNFFSLDSSCYLIKSVEEIHEGYVKDTLLTLKD